MSIVRDQRSVRPARRTSAVARLTRDHRAKMSTVAVLSLVGALSEALFLVLLTGVAMAMVQGTDSVGPVLGRTVPVASALVLSAVLLVVRLALNLGAVRVSANLTAAVTASQRRRLAHAYLKSSWQVQQGEPAGRLQELLTTFVNRVSNAVATLTGAVGSLLSLLAFLATGLVVNALSTIAVLFALALVGSVLVPLRRWIRRRAGESARANLDFANAVSELGSLGLEMQTFGVMDRFADRIDDLTERTTSAQRRVAMGTGSMPVIYISLAYAAVLVAISVLALIGYSDLAALGAIVLLMLRSLSYGQQLASASASLASSLPFLERVGQTVERYRESPAEHGGTVPSAVAPLVARGLGYSYVPDRPALFDVSFTIEPGEVIGVIGPSGAGKSTLAQLLLGLRSPSSGTLTVSGTDLREIDRAWWSRHVAFVAQDALLFTGTVAENIRFFREGIADSTLEDAARQANILADIERLPRGFETHLGERGSQLSGGQRQRLSIARALAGGPELLVLDEPTSALDARSEALIRDAIARLKGTATVVIIAHRLSTLDMCDRIMVIEDGTMTGFDTPVLLHADSSFYQGAMAAAGIIDRPGT
jgi:ATP-binding cassette subfamily B protein